ncbi:phosphate/phosphite/phosphonate ABC transporter substrate-binding protein [Thermodesulfobacteriota bacterium]
MNCKRFLIYAIFILTLFIALPANCGPTPQPLTILIHPYRTAAILTKNFTPLAEYLSKAANTPIRVEISKSYKSHMQQVGEEQFGLAYLGPAPYVQITHTYGAKTILGRLEVNGSPFFHGIIIARKDSSVKELKDLVNKKFAFGDPNSTMSHFVPRFMLAQAGVDIANLKDHAFLGMHANVALGVIGGYYDAGGVKENIFATYKDRGVKLLAKSPPISEHLFVAAKHIPPATVENIRQALYSLQDPTILSLIKKSLTGIVPSEDKDYDSLRVILKKFNKMQIK